MNLSFKKMMKKHQPTYLFYNHIIELYNKKDKTEKENILIQKITHIGQYYYSQKFPNEKKYSLQPMDKYYLFLGLNLLETHKLQNIKPKNFFQKKSLQTLKLQKNLSLFFLLQITHKKQKKLKFQNEFELHEKSVIQDIQKFALQNDLTKIAVLSETPKTDFGSVPKSRILDVSPQFVQSVINKHLEKHLTPQKTVDRIQLMKKISHIQKYFQSPIEIQRQKFMTIPILLKPKPSFSYQKKKIPSPQEILTNIHALRHQYEILSDDSALHYQKTKNGLLVEIPTTPFSKFS